MKKIFVLLFIFLGLNLQSNAAYYVNENCREAWMLLMDLRIQDAKDILADEVKQNPDNYYAYYLDQTCDAYKLLINSNTEEYERFIENYYLKREIMDGKDEDSPYYLSCYSEMEIQLGIFNIIKGDRLSGLRKAFSAYKNVYRNLDKFPDFKPSLKLDGFFNVAISNLPPFVKWAASFFGVEANPEYGFRILNENYQSQKNIKGINAESALFVILVAKINKTPEMVYNFTASLDSSVANTFIHKYFRANIAYRSGKNEEALQLLQQIDIDQHASAKIIYDYLMGKVLLRKLDPQAEQHLSSYLNHLQKKEYLKEINYQLALYHLINGDETKYLKYCAIVREEGIDINERDREALYEANLDYIPDVNLAKAHLLLDGGYFKRADDFLKKYETKKSLLLGHRLEYHFLKARYQSAIGNNENAIAEFKKTIDLGVGEDYSFACEAALLLGNTYERTGDFESAEEYYELSLKLYQSNFYEYLEDKASKALKNLRL